MSKARDPDPVRPSQEATKARRQAAEAAEQAEGHRREQVDKLAEAETEMQRLVGHRRANRFGELFREAFERRGDARP